MINHAGNRIWTDLARLDLSPDLPLGIYDLLSARIRRTHVGVASAVRQNFPELASRIDGVLDSAPQVLSSGTAYQWVTSVHTAMRTDNVRAFDDLDQDFLRFEAAAAVLSGGSFSTSRPWPTIPSNDPLSSDITAIPLVGAAVVERAGIRVTNGLLENKVVGPGRVGGLRVNAFESNYRLARSRSQFNLCPRGLWEQAHDEITTAAEIADILVPGLFDRYLTDVVPLEREGDISNAGTDEAAPFVVYASFYRNPVDLVACFAHEEAHALINSADKLLGGVLPDTELRMPVPWKPGQLRSLSNVIHGLISFGRAAQVRGRAALLGLSDLVNDKAREREACWVTQVSQELLEGSLGDLSDELATWVTTNVAALEPSLPGHSSATVVAGSIDPTATFAWTVVTGPEYVAAATERYRNFVTGPWLRGSGDYSTQDRVDVELGDSPKLDSLLVESIPAVISDRFGSEVQLTSVKAHRLRPGDSIGIHTDHGGDQADFRAVIGASALPTDGGLLRLCDSRKRPTTALPLRHGDTLVFEIAEPCYHDVTVLESESYRYTIIATYRRFSS